MSKKPVIVFEGIEGSGKTLHIDFVSKYLKKKKIDHVKIREPGGNKNSEKIRNLVLSNKSNFNKDTDLLLYLASRSENMEKLNKFYKKKVILLDRFIDSTIAYQHYGQGVDLNIIRSLNHYLLKKFRIDFIRINKIKFSIRTYKNIRNFCISQHLFHRNRRDNAYLMLKARTPK